MNTKAFEIEFHWVFIMIAGAVILAFFFTIAQKQHVLSEQKLALQLTNDLDFVFSAATAGKGIAQTITLPRTGVTFQCTSTCDCTFSLGTTATPFKDKTLYSPSTLDDPTAIIWSLDWKLPFHITNFLFLTQPSNQYLFVVDPNPSNQHARALQTKLSHELPTLLKTTFITPDSLAQHPITEHTRIIFLALPPNTPETLGLDKETRKKDISGLYVDSSHRKLTFYTKKDMTFQSQDAHYAGDAALYAAMFATNPQLYLCGMKQALIKLSHITEIYTQRASALENHMPSIQRNDCVYPLDSLEQLHTIATTQSTTLTPDPSLLETPAQQLTQQNENLIRQSCPELY